MRIADVSVVIPAYNAAGVIARALDSVLMQTIPAREILVVDDGSTDMTRDIVHTYCPKVTYIRQNNRGAAAARNHGIRMARSEWIAFLDADDEWLPHKLQLQMNILEEHSELMWCVSRMAVIRDAKVVASRVQWEAEPPSARGRVVEYFSCQLGRRLPEVFQTSGFLIRRSVFSQIGVFDPELKVSQDIDLWWRIAMEHPRLGYCPAVCHYYHVGTLGSLTTGCRNRSEGLRTVCTNMKRAIAHGSPVVAMFEPYGRNIAMDYLRRWAVRDIMLDAAVIQEAKRLFPLGLWDQVLVAGLRALPVRAARVVQELHKRVSSHSNPKI